MIKKSRIKVVLLGILFLFIAIVLKLFYEQILHHESVLSKAQNVWERNLQITGIRGDIVDRNGIVLATSIPSSSLVVVPSQIEDAKDTAKKLSVILEMDENELYEKIS